MRICRLILKGFRGIKTGQIIFPKHSVILGANNTGKSTIAEALTILVGRDRMIRLICDWDFYSGNTKPDSRFYLRATITDFPESAGNDPAEVPEWFLGENAARPVWWHEDNQVVTYETDQPANSTLAAEIALAGRYDDDNCEFEILRYFYYGDSDPFVDGCKSVPIARLRELGLFLLPSNRQWDKLFSFGSSTFLKLAKEYQALPGDTIEKLKDELKSQVSKAEESNPLSDILSKAENELRSFLLIDDPNKLAFRPTSLDSQAILRSLVAHLDMGDFLVPMARHGSGMISLQSFLVLIAFAEYRKEQSQNFILVAEEPELHLHPSLHQKLVNRIRATSIQSIVTTQSPQVASSYHPNEVVFIQNNDGNLESTLLRKESIKDIQTNSIKKLYFMQRPQFYEALMGGTVIIPEGMHDYEWLTLWQRLAQSVSGDGQDYKLRPISIVPTSDAAIVDTYIEIMKFQKNAIPMVDGDSAGQEYISSLLRCDNLPSLIITLGNNAAVECLSAWLLEPALSNPEECLKEILPDSQDRNLKKLQDKLCESPNKKNRELRENLVWEAINNSDCQVRVQEFMNDISALASGESPINQGWQIRTINGNIKIATANHITRL